MCAGKIVYFISFKPSTKIFTNQLLSDLWLQLKLSKLINNTQIKAFGATERMAATMMEYLNHSHVGLGKKQSYTARILTSAAIH